MLWTVSEHGKSSGTEDSSHFLLSTMTIIRTETTTWNWTYYKMVKIKASILGPFCGGTQKTLGGGG